MAMRRGRFFFLLLGLLGLSVLFVLFFRAPWGGPSIPEPGRTARGRRPSFLGGKGRLGKKRGKERSRKKVLAPGGSFHSLESCLSLGKSYGEIPRERYYRLRVFYGVSGDPVPSALVSWIPSGFPVGASSIGVFLFSGELEGFKRFEFVLEKGVKASTDGEGVARIPFGPWNTMVSVKKGDFAGMLTLAPPYPLNVRNGTWADKKVRLWKLVSFRVQALGASGQALSGVPLQAYTIDSLGRRRIAWRGTTGGNPCLARVRLMESCLHGPLGRMILVGFYGPIPSGKPVEVSLDPPPERPVFLRMEDAGRITVFVRNREGRPLGVKCLVSLRAKELTATGDSLRAQALLVHGAAEFPWVALGKSWWLSLKPIKGGRERLLWTGRGPVAPGEDLLVKATVPIGWEERRFFLRVSGKEGKPLADSTFFLEKLEVTAGKWERDPIGCGDTDKDGFLEVPPGLPGKGWYRLTRWTGTGPKGKPWGPFTVFSFPRGAGSPRPGGGILLGNVEITEGESVARGMVVGADGKGIPGVVLEFSSLQEGPFDPAAAPGDQVELLSGGDGRFDLRGNFQGRPISLSASKKGFKWISGERITPGDFNIRLKLEKKRRIQGVMIVDSLEVARHLTVVFERSGKGERPIRGRLARARKMGPGEWVSFTLDDGKPGEWSVRIVWNGLVVWSRKGIVLEEEKGASCSFFDPVDLRGRFREYVFLVRSDGGGPVREEVDLLLVGPGGKVFEARQPVLGKEGARRFPVPKFLSPIALTAKGYYREDVRGLSGDNDVVVLRKGLPVIFEITVPRQIPSRRRFLFKVDVFREPGGKVRPTAWERKVMEWPVASMNVFGIFGKRRVRLPGYGPYSVRWSVCKVGWGRRKGIPIELEHPSGFILERGKERVVRLTLDEKAAGKAIARLLGD